MQKNPKQAAIKEEVHSFSVPKYGLCIVTSLQRVQYGKGVEGK